MLVDGSGIASCDDASMHRPPPPQAGVVQCSTERAAPSRAHAGTPTLDPHVPRALRWRPQALLSRKLGCLVVQPLVAGQLLRSGPPRDVKLPRTWHKIFCAIIQSCNGHLPQSLAATITCRPARASGAVCSSVSMRAAPWWLTVSGSAWRRPCMMLVMVRAMLLGLVGSCRQPGGSQARPWVDFVGVAVYCGPRPHQRQLLHHQRCSCQAGGRSGSSCLAVAAAAAAWQLPPTSNGYLPVSSRYMSTPKAQASTLRAS